MSEEKLNKKAKTAVLTPIAILVVMCLLFGSCASNKCQFTSCYKNQNRNLCPAYR